MAFVPCRLAKYFVFNPVKFGLREENDFEKIFYYWPPGRDLGEQMMDVGLCEALVHLPKTFTTDTTTSCTTKRARYLLLHPEPGWWVVMVVDNPKGTVGENKDIVSLPDALDDEPLIAMLHRSYREFKLFSGGFETLLAQRGEKGLKEYLPKVLPEIVQELRPDKADLFSSLDGIHFLPVDKNVYLRIQSFLNYCENALESIRFSAFLYKEFLVWSGFEQDDMRTLYRWLNKPTSPVYDNGVRKSGFVCGPEEVGMAAPQVFILNSPHSNHLVIYQLSNCTCVFVVDSSVINKVTFYNQLQRIIVSHVEFLAPIISEHARKLANTDEYRYLYFNHMNLALKASLDRNQLAPDVSKVLNKMHSDFVSVDGLEEVLVGTMNDGWIVGKKSDQREFYIVFDQKNANLLEINDEVKKLSSTYFKDIFIDES